MRDYLAPLAAHPAIAPHVVFGATVEAVTRAGFDKVTSVGREDAPFVVRWRDRDGAERRVEARAVIDASGTWGAPNPMGVDGLAVEGERAAGDRIAYGIPDVLGRDRAAYAGRRVLVVGGGHSAINVALDLLRLQEDAPGTRVTWALRRDRFDRLLGGGINDELPERGALGLAAKRAIEAGQTRDARALRGGARCGERGRAAGDGTRRGPPDDAACRSDRGRDRLPAGARHAARAAGGARPGGRGAAGAGAADRSEPAFLRHGAAARSGRARASGARASTSSARSPTGERRPS